MRSAHVKSVSSLGALVALASFSLALLAPAVASAWSGQLLWARGVETGLDNEEFGGRDQRQRLCRRLGELRRRQW